MPSFALSTILGDQIPVIALLEVDGKVGTFPPEQILNVVPKEKVGVTDVMSSLTVTQNSWVQLVSRSVTVTQ